MRNEWYRQKGLEFKMFKYELPNNCPKILTQGNKLRNGDYDICYFRITQNSPPTADDFIPQFFLIKFNGRRKKLERERNFSQLCQMAGISLLKERDEAKKLMRKFKKIGKYIYKGIVTHEHGLVIMTPSRNNPLHCSFYVYVDVDEITIFRQRVE